MFSYEQVLEKCRNKPKTSEYHTVAEYYDDIISIYGDNAKGKIKAESITLLNKNKTKSAKLLRSETEAMVSFLCESCPYEPECSGPNSLASCSNEMKDTLIASINSVADWMKKEKVGLPDNQVTSFAWYIFQAIFAGKQVNAEHNTFDLEVTALELFLKEQHTWLVSRYGWEGENLKDSDNNEYTDVPAFVIDTLWHFKKAGFPVSAQTVERFLVLSELVNMYDISELYSLLKFLLCKTTEDEKKFNYKFYSKYAEYIPEINRADAKSMDTSRENSIRLKQELEKVSRQEESIKTDTDNQTAAMTTIKNEIMEIRPDENELIALRSAYLMHRYQIDRILGVYRENKSKKFLMSLLNGTFKPEYYLTEGYEEVKNMVEESMRSALFQNDAVEIIDIFSQVKKILADTESALSLMKEEYDTENRKYSDSLRNQQDIRDRIEHLSKELDKENIIIKKTESIFHRKEFIGGYRSIQSDSKGEIGEMEFCEMQEKDKKALYSNIRINAEKIRKVMHKNIKSKEKQKLDLSETVKHACGTGGIPIKLFYKKPRKASPNIVMILDVSGSCRNASETMLVFMHHMQTVFQGGCKAFAFVREMYDVTNAIKGDDPEDAVKNVLEMIPTRGVYSSYEIALEDMKRKYMSCINKDSYVFFIGDARNNSNDPKEEIVKEIAEKANKCYWLNTEKRNEWNISDSVIDIYAKYMDKVTEIVKTNQFLEFMKQVS